MHGLLAPLLAQLVTLAVADRLEGHYVLNKDEHYAQSTNATNPRGTLGFNWRRATLSFTYSPSFQLVPVWSSDAE